MNRDPISRWIEITWRNAVVLVVELGNDDLGQRTKERESTLNKPNKQSQTYFILGGELQPRVGVVVASDVVGPIRGQRPSTAVAGANDQVVVGVDGELVPFKNIIMNELT